MGAGAGSRFPTKLERALGALPRELLMDPEWRLGLVEVAGAQRPRRVCFVAERLASRRGRRAADTAAQPSKDKSKLRSPDGHTARSWHDAPTEKLLMNMDWEPT